jgi:hypothetical protein
MAYEPLKFLDAADVVFEAGAAGELIATVKDVRYEDVKPARTHPMSDPYGFLSLRGTPAGGSGDVELGILRSMQALAPQQRSLVDAALARRYLGTTIVRILGIREEFGYMYWDVLTDRGERQLVLPRWNQSHVSETGSDGEGRVVLDVWGNRALIKDVSQLDEKSLRLFERFVHW